jgi:hypothetical protein
MGARTLEAEALAALAETYLAKREVEASYDAAQAAVSIAEVVPLRAVLFRALKTLGEASEALGRSDDASQARSRAEELRDQLRGNLMAEHVDAFLKQSSL